MISPIFFRKSKKWEINLVINFFLPFYWPRAQHVTWSELPTNNGVLRRKTVQKCLAARNVLLMRD